MRSVANEPQREDRDVHDRCISPEETVEASCFHDLQEYRYDSRHSHQDVYGSSLSSPSCRCRVLAWPCDAY